MKPLLIILSVWLAPFFVNAQECPELECHSGLTVFLYPLADSCGGYAWINDLVVSDHASCPEPPSFVAYKEADVLAAGDAFSPDFNDPASGLFFGMSDATGELINVIVYMQNGNGDVYSCTTYVHISSNYECPPVFENCFLSGRVSTTYDEGIEGADILYFSETDTTSFTTGDDGAFSITCDDSYTLQPRKNDDSLNGISTFDLVLMSKHILGTDLLDTPFKLIAADVNNSGSVSTLDMIHLRRLILGIYTEFPNNSSWRFIPINYDFPEPNNPWSEDFPESLYLDFNAEFSEQVTIFSFYGIKIGDVSGNAIPH